MKVFHRKSVHEKYIIPSAPLVIIELTPDEAKQIGAVLSEADYMGIAPAGFREGLQLVSDLAQILDLT